MHGLMKMSLKMPEATYIPGSCNIGSGEVRRRQMVALVGLILSVIAFIGLISANATGLQKLGIFFPLFITSIGYVQSRSKFCLAYGFAGSFNFGKLGELSRVSDPLNRAADRKTALTILLKSFLLAAIATLVVIAVPF